MSAIDRLLEGIPIPRVMKLTQSFPRPKVEDVESELMRKLSAKGALAAIKPGQTVAVTVGSRGITNMPLIVRTVVREIRKAGGEPFLFPAMGSHGGATAEGQKAMIVSMGYTEEYIGAPIRSTMDVVEVGRTDTGMPVYLDRFAHEADAIVLVNRIKPHVAFRAKYESGLMKMIAIGIGKHKGADTCHDMGFGVMAQNILDIGRIALAKLPIPFGVGILENAYHETARIEVLLSREIEPEEPALQEEAKRLSPRILFDSLDSLIIDEIGKDISGTGFDNNAIGRYHTPYVSGGPSITRVAALSVTEISHGNANGLGILDFTTRRAFDRFDFEQTYPNSLTSTVPTSVKIPMVLKNDRQAIQAAIKTCNIPDKAKVRLARIKNTLKLGEIEVSENLLEEVRRRPGMEVASEPYAWTFNDRGNLF